MRDENKRRFENRRKRDRRHWTINGPAGPLSERRCHDHLIGALVLIAMFVVLEHYFRISWVAKPFEFVGAAVVNRFLFGAGA